MEWLKRAYYSAGLTQFPVGKHLSALQDRLGGSVILCLDVSGSMAGNRIPQAAAGCKLFVTEAVDAGYLVAGVLWDDGVRGHTELSRDRLHADRLFESATVSGGTNILPTLKLCEQKLEGRSGDRVIAIFGDGDLGDASAALAEAQRLVQKGIRVITCGLGDASAEELGKISTESSAPRVAKSDDIAGAIAGMASALKRRT